MCTSDLDPKELAKRHLPQNYIEMVSQIQQFDDRVKSFVQQERLDRRNHN